METQRVLENIPPSPTAPTGTAALRSVLEQKARELEKVDVDFWSRGLCGVI